MAETVTADFGDEAIVTDFHAVVQTRPPRLYIETLEPLAGAIRTVEAQFNPVGFSDKIEAKYVGWEVPGLSHEVLQFISTKNYQLPFDLRFIVDQSFSEKSSQQINRFLGYRNILMALAYPKAIGGGSRGQATINGVAPHRVLVVWPDLIAMTCVLKSCSTTYNRFNNQGQLVDFTCRIEFSEIRDERISADEALQNGTFRTFPPMAIERSGLGEF